MSTKYKASLIISFYNNIDALRCIFNALTPQYKHNLFEVIIADDGSKEECAEDIKKIQDNSPIPIIHIRHDDIGFRKNRILNKAVSLTSSPYLIFIDGDCIPQENFVEDHINNSSKNTILNGRRVDLAEIYRTQLYSCDNPHKFFKENFLSIFINYLIGKGKNIEKGIRIQNPYIFHILNNKNKGIVGCNFSLNKEDFLSVNGFNNRYEHPCIGEDTDIEYRLVATGKCIKNIFHQAVILHVIHQELPRLQQSMDLFEETKIKKQFVAINGYKEAFIEK